MTPSICIQIEEQKYHKNIKTTINDTIQITWKMLLYVHYV